MSRKVDLSKPLTAADVEYLKQRNRLPAKYTLAEDEGVAPTHTSGPEGSDGDEDPSEDPSGEDVATGATPDEDEEDWEGEDVLPDEDWTNADIKAWLEDEGIDHTGASNKAQLLALVPDEE